MPQRYTFLAGARSEDPRAPFTSDVGWARDVRPAGQYLWIVGPYGEWPQLWQVTHAPLTRHRYDSQADWIRLPLGHDMPADSTWRAVPVPHQLKDAYDAALGHKVTAMLRAEAENLMREVTSHQLTEG